MTILVILNEPPYGTERSYNGLRLALSLAKQPEVELRVFLMADAVRCAQRGQQTPEGHYNIERMLTGLRGQEGSHRCLRDVHGRPRHGRRGAHRGRPSLIDGRAHHMDAVG